MTEPVQPRVLAETGGAVVAEQGPLVLVIDRGTGPLATTAFVLGVLAVVFGGFGAVTLAVSAGGRSDIPPVVSAVFVAVGLVFAAATAVAVRRIKANGRRPLTDYRPVAVFDRAHGVFTDADGAVVAPLPQVQFQRRMQIGSSSPKLVATTPNGDWILKRGNPFSGGIGDLDAVLTAVVHGR
ncbi:hypothetical protein [Mycolicibacterium sp. HK-90]|uniref:hypothetical protein n=1 Tax=Mycolicibacterium sp. HK-90 TaxID=3056937 RepID=UPI00265A6F0A|nr:hypothetical protein [Mycolicibacterium sp. HK-90]WKG06079.1 hypothetical protein QU592_13820 [Mycolicibacterium sp. HK-90]